MRNFLKPRNLLLAVAAASPLVVVIACGELSASPAIGYSSINDFFTATDKLAVNVNNSVHSKLNWNGIPTQLAPSLLADYFAPEYSTSSFTSAQAAIADDSTTNWSKTLPTQIAPKVEERNLWVRVRAKNPTTNRPTQVRDLLVSSQLNLVKIAIDDLASFKSFNLNQVTLSGEPLGAEVSTNLPTDLSSLVRVEWLLNEAWVDATTLRTYLTNNSQTITQAFIDALKVRLFNIDSNVAVLTSKLSASPRTSGFSIPVILPNEQIKSLFDALPNLELIGNAEQLALSVADTNKRAQLIQALLVNNELTITYASSKTSTQWTPLFDKTTLPLSAAEYQSQLSSGVKLANSAALWSALNSSKEIYVRIEKISPDSATTISPPLAEPVTLNYVARNLPIDVTSVQASLAAGSALSLSGASDAVVTRPNLSLNSNLDLKVRFNATDPWIKWSDVDTYKWNNVWLNDRASYISSNFEYQLTATNGATLFNTAAPEKQLSSITDQAPLVWTSISPLVISTNLALNSFSITGDSAKPKLAVSTLPDVANVTYEWRFNQDDELNKVALVLPAGITPQTWYNQIDFERILALNSLYGHQQWNTQSIIVRAKPTTVRYSLASKLETTRTIWSSTNNDLEIFPDEREFGPKREYVIKSLANLTLAEYRNDQGNYYLFNNYGTNKPPLIEYLAQKILTRLPHGVEIAALQKMIFMSTGTSFYESQSATTTVGIYDFLSPQQQWNPEVAVLENGRYRIVNYEAFADAVTERTFQALCHEYGHHVGTVYLNGIFRTQQNVPASQISSSKTRYGKDSTWDADFMRTFVTTLGYDSDAKTQLPNQVVTPSPGATPIVLTPLSNLISRKDLFSYNWTMPEAEWDLPFSNEVYEKYMLERYREVLSALERGERVTFTGANTIDKTKDLAGWNAVNLANIKFLNYLYSVGELFTKAMLQATMTLAPVTNFIDDWGYDKARSANGDSMLIHEDAEAYTNDIKSQPYASDYLFRPAANGSGVDNSHAKTIVKALQDRMGYTDGADISHIFWKRSVYSEKYNPDNTLKDTNWFRFGGFVPDQRFKYVGFYAPDGTFKSVPISVMPFNYFAKPTWNARQYETPDPTKKNFTYVTESWLDRDVWANQPLYFSTDEAGTQVQALTSFNPKASTDVTGNYDPSRAGSSQPFISKVIFGANNANGQTYLAMRDNPKEVLSQTR